MLRKGPFHRFHDGKRGAALTVRVVPRASRTEIVDILEDGTLRIRVAAPPSRGEANRALIDFLARVLDVPRSRIEIAAGATRRDKILVILDVSPKEVEDRLQAYMAKHNSKG